jgi:Ca2+-binding RTX toxin-like protein
VKTRLVLVSVLMLLIAALLPQVAQASHPALPAGCTAGPYIDLEPVDGSTAGADVYIDTAGADYVHDLAGNNTYLGSSGNDCIVLGGGNDTVSGGTGNDYIDAGDGNNAVTDLGGNNTVTVGGGNDDIATSAGNDRITAGDGNNEVQAGGGNDVLIAGSGNDNPFDGGAGTDACDAGGGANTVTNCETPVDGDGDGVEDPDDNCPVDSNGAQTDTDGDGAGDACDLDDDGDGVNDGLDLCPGTPAGAAVNADGCSPAQLDTDGDGVNDGLDLCPGTPAGAVVNADGCSPAQLDTDGDTVNDALDLCPGTAPGAVVNADGCSPAQLDTDGDGVNNALDLCPGTPAGTVVDATGCPVGAGGAGGAGGGGGGGGGGGVVVPAPTPTPSTPAAPGRCVDLAPTSDFTDVWDGQIHERSIDCIAWKQITTGVSATRYGPGQITTRGQMASFLARTIAEIAGALPAGTDRFNDDDGSPHESAINRLASAGIIEGTGRRTYSPRDKVRRDQMASMIVHTYEYLTDGPASSGSDAFTDDNGNVHESAINAGADLGLLLGRGTDRYVPGAGTRRDQMASFLTRLLEAFES